MSFSSILIKIFLVWINAIVTGFKIKSLGVSPFACSRYCPGGDERFSGRIVRHLFIFLKKAKNESPFTVTRVSK
jgi:hypothetical protein